MMLRVLMAVAALAVAWAPPASAQGTPPAPIQQPVVAVEVQRITLAYGPKLEGAANAVEQ